LPSSDQLVWLTATETKKPLSDMAADAWNAFSALP